jgi:hypothetical protein
MIELRNKDPLLRVNRVKPRKEQSMIGPIGAALHPISLTDIVLTKIGSIGERGYHLISNHRGATIGEIGPSVLIYPRVLTAIQNRSWVCAKRERP